MRWRIPKNKFMVKSVERTKFLWFPKCCHGEWRWLETVSWHGEITWWSYFPMFKTMLWPYWFDEETYWNGEDILE